MATGGVSVLGIPAGVPQPRAGRDGIISAASVNAAAALRNYHLNPRLGEFSFSFFVRHQKKKGFIWGAFFLLLFGFILINTFPPPHPLIHNLLSQPLADYGTISGVNGPLVILDNVKVRHRKNIVYTSLFKEIKLCFFVHVAFWP